MSKTKKLTAATLAVLALAAAPGASVASAGGGVLPLCQGGGNGCQNYRDRPSSIT